MAPGKEAYERGPSYALLGRLRRPCGGLCEGQPIESDGNLVSG